MKLTEKIVKLFIVLIYIILNILFYNTVFREYPNIILFIISVLLFISEIFFWVVLFSLLDSPGINIRIRNIEYIFLISLAGIGISRIFLYSSPYLNDLINTRYFFIYLVGFLRVFFIFTSIINLFYLKDSKSKILFIVSFLNLVSTALVWLDFDSNINAIIRIIIGILILIYVIIFKEKTVSDEKI